MPAQPSLYKPKSKLRLRLGLTPPHPKSSTKHVAPPLPLAISPPRSSSLAISTLSESVSSTTTGASRPDSRSLFTYDSTSPSASGDHPQPGAGLGFDTISYASTSPASVAFDRAVLPSPRHHYPTPSTSGYDTHGEDADGDGEADLELDMMDQGDGIDRPSLDAYPNIRSVIKASDDVFYLADKQLSDRFHFVDEVGFGNWGSVWLAKPRRSYFSHADMTPSQRAVRKLGKAAAARGGSGAGGKVALKIVHRVNDSCTAARIRALWGEMKIIRSLRHEPHPSIIQFEAFCCTPSYAIIIMPYLSHLIQVCLPPKKAAPYFRQLASAVGYLHERGITHNDIKPANVMISHNDIPVLVDFGFAHKWPTDGRGAFLSTISWGTPEYLDPYRAQGLPHDERASDVWSLGITFYEILIGRTPFEENEEEEFQEPERYALYLERSLNGEWMGEYHIPSGKFPLSSYRDPADTPDLTHLLQNMLHINPANRISAMQAYHHPALHLAPPSVIVTPHFIREATSFDDYAEEAPLPVAVSVGVALGGPAGGDDKKRRKKKVAPKESQRSVTPALPLGESIKQHTSVPRSKRVNGGLDKEGTTPSPKKGSRLVIKKMRSAEEIGGDEEDITPTKIVKPAQPLKMQDISTNKDKKLISRPSQAQLRDTSLSRPTSRNPTGPKHDSTLTLKTTGTNSTRSSLVSKENLGAKTLSHRASNLSTLSAVSTVHGKESEDEARSRTLQSLEGKVGVKKRDVLGAISRPAPEPPRPMSVDSAVVEVKKEEVQRRSWGAERILSGVEETVEVDETAESKVDLEVLVSSSSDGDRARDIVFHTGPRSKESPMAQVGSPPRKRMAKPAMPDSPNASDPSGPMPKLAFTASPSVKKGAASPASVKERMMTNDHKLGRFRQISGDLTPAQFTPSSTQPIHAEPTRAEEPEPSLQHRKSIEALALDNRLDKISEWVKTVESIVEEARKALAEGRELPLPLLTMSTPADLAGLPDMPGTATHADTNLPTPRSVGTLTAEQRAFGVSPDKAMPEHLRTSSVQVEPATPPKWMTLAEAEEKIKKANAWMEDGRGSRPNSGMIMGTGDVKRFGGKKERGSVANVLKMFGAEKEKDKAGVRTSTPEPNMHIPLKPPAPALRATPSTPMLRSDSSFPSGPTASATQRLPARKSESNLRAFNTVPSSFSDLLPQSAFSDDDDEDDDYYAGKRPSSGRPGSPRSPRRLYERFLDSTPGVVRQGDGWSSLSSGRALAKPSSMASLRERARALLHGDTHPHPHPAPAAAFTAGPASGRNIVDLANQERRNSKQPLVHSYAGGKERFGTASSAMSGGMTEMLASPAGTRPNTPGAGSVLTSTTGTTQKGWGIWKGLKGLGKKGRAEEVKA